MGDIDHDGEDDDGGTVVGTVDRERELALARTGMLDVLRVLGREGVTEAVFSGFEAKWLEERMNGVGSSEVAALFNLCPDSWKHGTPLKLYAHKTRQAPPVDETEAMLMGRLQEPVVAARAQIALPGIRIFAPPPWTTFRLANAPRVMASIDRLTFDPDGVRVLELKTADTFMDDEWEDDDGVPRVPIHYQMQVQAQLHVLGLERARVAVLIGRRFLQPFSIEKEPGVGAEIERRVEAFWRCVEDKTPPKAGRPDLDAINWLHPKATPDKKVDLGAEGFELFSRWDAARVKAAEAKDEIDTIKARVGELMGDAAFGVVGGRKASFKNQTRVTQPNPAIPETLAFLRALREGTLPADQRETMLNAAIELMAEAAVPKVWEGRVMMPPYLKVRE